VASLFFHIILHDKTSEIIAEDMV